MSITNQHPNISEALKILEKDDDNWERHFVYHISSNDFDFVTDKLAIGAGVYNAKEARAVAKAGVTHVIDCRAEAKVHDLWKRHPDVAYLWNGFGDDHKPKGPNVWARPLRFAINALDQGGTVLTHCAAGISRGPSMGYAVLRAYYGLKPAAAFAAIQAVRPCAAIFYAADVEIALLELGYEGS